MPTIHILEHDASCRGALAGLLKQRGHAPQNLDTAHDYFYQLNKQPPRCVVVDWTFSDISGLEIVQRTRQLLGGHVGLIMLTDTEREDRAVLALDAGADDCFARPARDALLVARIEALLRRLVPAQVAQAKRLSVGPYTLDLGARSVTVSGVNAGLAPREFDLAWILLSQPGLHFSYAGTAGRGQVSRAARSASRSIDRLGSSARLISRAMRRAWDRPSIAACVASTAESSGNRRTLSLIV
jgi:DNA-binding response OmpR family regulator